MEPTTEGRLSSLERVGLVAFLAVVGATQVPTLAGRGFWLDEAFSIGATHDLFATLRRTSGTMAAFYGVLVPWRAISDDRAWLRLLPLVFALAALGIAYQQARRRWGWSVASLTAATMASSVLFLRWSTELRSYSLALLAVTAGWYALLRWVDEEDGAAGSRWRWVWAGTGVLAVTAHGLAAFQIAAQLGAVAFHPDRRRLLRRAWPALGGLGLAGALWLAGARNIGVQQLADRESLVRVWAGVTARPYPLRGLRTLVFGGAASWGLATWWRARDRTEEVGIPRRHYDDVANDLASTVATGPERVFVVGQPNSRGSDPVEDLVTDPEVLAAYEPVAEATFHREIEVVVLERR